VWCARASGRLGVLDLRSWPILALRDEEAVQEVQDASGSYHGRKAQPHSPRPRLTVSQF
jgi:hypothetical protein